MSAEQQPEILSPEWRRWVVENLLRGGERSEIVANLVENGVPAPLAETVVREIKDTASFQTAHATTRPLRQQEFVLRMQREVSRCCQAPVEIIRRPGLSGPDFFQAFYATNTPVIIPGFVDAWPARTRWTPEYLVERYGDVAVKAACGRESDPHYDMRTEQLSQTMPMREYTARVLNAGESNDLYMVANNRNIEAPDFAPILEDVVYDPAFFDASRWKGCTAFWFGPAGTVTPLHHDTCNILFTQFYGRKAFKLISPVNTALLRGAVSMYAPIDPENPDLELMPEFEEMTVLETVLEPGDALFLPVGWWHHVRALDVSISLASTNFIQPNNFQWYRPGDQP